MIITHSLSLPPVVVPVRFMAGLIIAGILLITRPEAPSILMKGFYELKLKYKSIKNHLF